MRKAKSNALERGELVAKSASPEIERRESVSIAMAALLLIERDAFSNGPSHRQEQQ